MAPPWLDTADPASAVTGARDYGSTMDSVDALGPPPVGPV
eukprot:COSAG04_NODE_10658_length_761_cov_0.765861_1_plen_39_part_10